MLGLPLTLTLMDSLTLVSSTPLSLHTRLPIEVRSHFETTAKDVQSLYERVTGKELDLTIDPEVEEEG